MQCVLYTVCFAVQCICASGAIILCIPFWAGFDNFVVSLRFGREKAGSLGKRC